MNNTLECCYRVTLYAVPTVPLESAPVGVVMTGGVGTGTVTVKLSGAIKRTPLLSEMAKSPVYVPCASPLTGRTLTVAWRAFVNKESAVRYLGRFVGTSRHAYLLYQAARRTKKGLTQG